MSTFDWKQFSPHLATPQTKKHAQTIARLVDSILKEDPGLTERTAWGFKTARELADAIDLNNLIEETRESSANGWFVIDPRFIYCSMTGHKLGQRTDEDLKLAMQIHGVNKMPELVKYNLQSSISAAWMYKSGRDLHKLSEADPIGYYVYAISKMFERSFDNLLAKKDAEHGDMQFALLKEKIRANQTLHLLIEQHAITLHDIIAANEALRHFLALIDPARLPHVARMKIWDKGGYKLVYLAFQVAQVEELLKKIIANLLYRETQFQGRVSMATMVAFSDKFGGLSSFKSQGRNSPTSEMDYIRAILAENTIDDMIQYGADWERARKSNLIHPGEKTTFVISAETLSQGFTLKTKPNGETKAPVNLTGLFKKTTTEVAPKKNTLMDLLRQAQAKRDEK